MEINEIFIKASREKYRFNFKGQISVEDLWDLNLKDLNTIFQSLNRVIKTQEEESLLDDTAPKNVDVSNKIAIIRYIVTFKKEEAKKRENARAKREKKETIDQLIAEKKNDALRNMSIDELEALRASM